MEPSNYHGELLLARSQQGPQLHLQAAVVAMAPAPVLSAKPIPNLVSSAD